MFVKFIESLCSKIFHWFKKNGVKLKFIIVILLQFCKFHRGFVWFFNVKMLQKWHVTEMPSTYRNHIFGLRSYVTIASTSIYTLLNVGVVVITLLFKILVCTTCPVPGNMWQAAKSSAMKTTLWIVLYCLQGIYFLLLLQSQLCRYICG